MLDRRDFLKAGAVGGAAAATAAAVGTTGCGRREEPGALDRERATGRAPLPVVPAFELEEWTVERLAGEMATGALTAVRIAEIYLERIEEIDRRGGTGPGIGSILEVNPEALDIAAALDAERGDGRLRGPLHGVPVLLKDNIDTGDRMLTTAGSLALAAAPAAADSGVARRLRAAGCVLLGKTNLSEWANFRSSRSSSGWSARGGQTANPYALDRNPCGSSSGSGAAVAANLAPLAVGTETDGSILCPANANGVVGIKPTVGLVSRSGIVPISPSQDTAGPMCRTVADAAVLLGALAGVDENDPATAASVGRGRQDYTPSLEPAGLAGARIGVWRERFGFHERVDAILEEAIAAMREAGAEIVDPIEIPSIAEIGGAEFTVLLYEFKDGIERYLATRGPEIEHQTLADLVEFNRENAAIEMPYFRQEIFEQAVEKGPLTDPDYVEALATCRRLARDEGLDRVFGEHRLDAVVAPSGGPAWVTDLVNGDHFGGGSSRAAAVAGYPNVTVPAGFVFGLPVGVSYMGAAWSESTLLRLAYAYEQATRARRAPRFLPTADLGG